MNATSSRAADLVDVDFSLAMHNRTGKYFIGRDLLETPGLPVGRTYYWMRAMKAPPEGFQRKLMNRLQHEQVMGRTNGGLLGVIPARRNARPLLHMDPYTVPTVRLRATDAVLCHDMGPLTHADLFDPAVVGMYRSIYAEIGRVGPHMVFVSKATREAFEACLPDARPTSSRVIYPAIRTDIDARDAIPVEGLGRFLLTVGALGDRKNQLRCISAFERSGLAAHGVQYVLCGAREPGYDEVAALAAATPGVVQLSYVSDGQLAWLYGAASGFVLASLLEGFGMPVSEAIARGQVPLVSRDSVLHEVAGDGALTVDPIDAGEIARGMILLAGMTDAEREARMRELRAAISRFELGGIRRQWLDAFGDFRAGAARQI